MKDFKSNNKFGGGGRGGDRGGFRGGNTFGKRDWNGPKQMYDAICAKCGKSCQVPFRPSGERPVYCHDCFDKTKSNNGEQRNLSTNRVEGRDGGTVPAVRPIGSGNNSEIVELKKLLGTINTKLDRLLQKAEGPVKEVMTTSGNESVKETGARAAEPSKKASSAKKSKSAAKKTTGKKK